MATSHPNRRIRPRKKNINTDDIVIGATKSDVTPETLRLGRVTFFNSSKGYGFIKDDRTQESIFVHTTSIVTPIKENDKVSFQTERGNRGLAAVNVKKI
jgi:cold shock CspA family protein